MEVKKIWGLSLVFITVAAILMAVPNATFAQVDKKTGYASVNGLKIYYEVHGDLDSEETPLLILHGSFMSAEAMAPLTERFATSRPVIAITQRGHGRTGAAPGSLTYKKLADDATGVLEALDVETADVLGYSMGATAAIAMAVYHPERVGKQIILSGTYRRDGWYPEALKAMAQMTPEMFAETPMEAEYKRLSPTPESFSTLVKKMKGLDAEPYGWPENDIRAIDGKTMIVVGDADGVELEHAIRLFELRGGGDREAAAKGFMNESPEARLTILPATSHIGIMARAELIVDLVTPFLEDDIPPMPEGFF
ncbi:alpha/beta fold hydrolase [Fodinibius salsisoli]|uniref:Alpha/beta hydrolase n=1 Tax=Fodinibius salsisoli TaxID=2820877 RepID=A0ABT3PK07_9BACT|nr:alpha/beta hydrolase [Fodinibius salsisoli]MCW9706279.1 alpha/beta hydrolase [Fodinibius salsisoli]